MSQTLTTSVLKKYPNRIFVETGTAEGGGIQVASECGFEVIHSIELDPGKWGWAFQRFKDLRKPRVEIYCGDSSILLPEVLHYINEPATFWIDAHIPEKGQCPAMAELLAIGAHPIKTHTIMIDDWNDFDTPLHGYIPKDAVIAALKEINPAYQISFEMSKKGIQDIIAAHL